MPTPRKTWQEKISSKAILKKVNRKNNPVSSLVQLAEEFGAPVYGPYFHYGVMTNGKTAGADFRATVRKEVGTSLYNVIRQGHQVRA